MRTFSPEEATNGMYLVLGSVVHEKDYLFTVQRGVKIQLVKIPTDLLSMPPLGGLYVLEIKEAGGYKVPLVRAALDQDEVARIKKFEPTGGTPRHGCR